MNPTASACCFPSANIPYALSKERNNKSKGKSKSIRKEYYIYIHLMDITILFAGISSGNFAPGDVNPGL